MTAQTTGTMHAKFEAGPLAEWSRWTFQHPALPFVAPGKLFLSVPLGLTGMEVSLNLLPPGEGMPFGHRHRKNEELYIFFGGSGEMTLDGETFPIREGTTVRVAPPVVRTWRNTGAGPLLYAVIQARAGSMPGGTIEDGEVVEDAARWRARDASPPG